MMSHTLLLGISLCVLILFSRWLLRRPFKFGPATPLPHPLNTLPPELWHQVTTFLDPASRASLAVANRMFFYLLGSQYWENLNSPELKADKIRFLNFFNPFLPRHFLCAQCAIFHRRPWFCDKRIEVDDMYRCRFRDPETGQFKRHETPSKVSLRGPITYLRWANVQSAARYLRYGPRFGIPLPGFDAVYSITAFPNGHAQLQGWVYALDSTICDDDHFIFRLEAVKDIPWMTLTSVELEAQFECFPTPDCRHFYPGLDRMLACAKRHVDESVRFGFNVVELCKFCRKLRRCHACATEYKIGIETVTKVEDEGVIELVNNFRLRVLRWTDCGNGWDPNHQFWVCHSAIPQDIPPRGPHEFDMGGLQSVRTRFEKAKGREAPDEEIETLAVVYR